MLLHGLGTPRLPRRLRRPRHDGHRPTDAHRPTPIRDEVSDRRSQLVGIPRVWAAWARRNGSAATHITTPVKRSQATPYPTTNQSPARCPSRRATTRHSTTKMTRPAAATPAITHTPLRTGG